jgi:hypothetical protein
MNDLQELTIAFADLARATLTPSVVTDAPPVTTVRGVITSTSPLRARVGIATTWTSVTNTIVGYTPAIGHVVVISRTGHRQFITGKV